MLADGAVWIWRWAENRFKKATQRVDYWHVSEPLWAVAHDRYGLGTPEASQWVKPLLTWLKRRNDGALDGIDTLQQIRANPSD